MIAGALGVVEVPVVVGWGRTGARMNGSVAVAVILVVATVLGARHAFEWVPDRVLAARVAVVLEGVAVEEEASAASVRAAGWELVARAVGKAAWVEALEELVEGESKAAAVVVSVVEGKEEEAVVLEMAEPEAKKEGGEWRPVVGVQEVCHGHRLCRGSLGMLWLRGVEVGMEEVVQRRRRAREAERGVEWVSAAVDGRKQITSRTVCRCRTQSWRSRRRLLCGNNSRSKWAVASARSGSRWGLGEPGDWVEGVCASTSSWLNWAVACARSGSRWGCVEPVDWEEGVSVSTSSWSNWFGASTRSCSRWGLGEPVDCEEGVCVSTSSWSSWAVASARLGSRGCSGEPVDREEGVCESTSSWSNWAVAFASSGSRWGWGEPVDWVEGVCECTSSWSNGFVASTRSCPVVTKAVWVRLGRGVRAEGPGAGCGQGGLPWDAGVQGASGNGNVLPFLEPCGAGASDSGSFLGPCGAGASGPGGTGSRAGPCGAGASGWPSVGGWADPCGAGASGAVGVWPWEPDSGLGGVQPEVEKVAAGWGAEL